MMDILGIIGVVLLMGAYTTLITKYDKLFPYSISASSILLTIHAVIISDFAFIVVNGFVSIIGIIKIFKGRTKK